jgi:hypothetical protein
MRIKIVPDDGPIVTVYWDWLPRVGDLIDKMTWESGVRGKHSTLNQVVETVLWNKNGSPTLLLRRLERERQEVA